MALDQSVLLNFLGKLKLTDVTDRIRRATETLYQELIDARANAFIAGDLDLKIPKLRAGTFFPALLERRRCIDQALFAVVMEAYLHGVSTRTVDDFVKALGADTGISKSDVSRICAGLNAEVVQSRDRSLSALDFPYVFLDATYCKARVDHRIVSQAIVVAVGVAPTGGGKCSASTLGTLRMKGSGLRSSSRWRFADSTGGSLSCPTCTPA